MKKTSNSLIKKRLIFLGLGLPLVLLVMLFARYGWLQIIDQGEIMNRFQGQVEGNYELQTPRGTITDRNGRELAVSIMARSLYGDPLMLNRPAKEVAEFLAPLIGEKVENLTEALSQKNRFVWLKRGMDPPDAQELQKKIREADIQGLGFLEESKRFYPSNKMAAGVLGFVGVDDRGLYGLEMKYDKELKGSGHRRKLLTDNLGRPIFESAVQNHAIEDNQVLQTTLDSNIQFICEKWIDQAMVDTKAAGAAIIVMDTQTGAILALANRPTFDPNEFWKYPAETWRNHGVSTLYEPGSTFKALIAAAALQEGKVTPNEMFYDDGTFKVGGRTLKNWDGSGLGNVSFTEIVKYSLNTGFMTVGDRVGGKKLNEYVRLFGMGKATGVDLPGEEDGILFDDATMMPVDVATMSIGQGIAVTPMQMISAFSMIANGGKKVQPHIVDKIYGADGSLLWEFKLGIQDAILRPEINKEVISLLEKVVSEGGGARAKVDGYRFAGKTGTAEKLNTTSGGYLDGRYIASFAGFGPLEDPRIAILVIIDDPNGMYYGGVIAAPVFSHVAGEIMQYLGIPPTLPYHKGIELAANQVPHAAGVVKIQIKDGMVIMPALQGYSLRQTTNALAPYGIFVIPTGSGRIVRQEPAAGTLLQKGEEIHVYLESVGLPEVPKPIKSKEKELPDPSDA